MTDIADHFERIRNYVLENNHWAFPDEALDAIEAEVAELRRIVVAAKEYADAEDELTASFEITDSLEFANRSRVAQQRVTNALAKVYSAVRGEA